MKKKYCSYCGKELGNSVKFCANCGRELDNNNIRKEKYPFLWGLLGFFFPFVGLILFLVWLREKPVSSKYAGIGALIRVLLYVYIVFVLLLFIFLELFFGVDKGTNHDTRDDFPHQQEVYGEDDWS